MHIQPGFAADLVPPAPTNDLSEAARTQPNRRPGPADGVRTVRGVLVIRVPVRKTIGTAALGLAFLGFQVAKDTGQKDTACSLVVQGIG